MLNITNKQCPQEIKHKGHLRYFVDLRLHIHINNFLIDGVTEIPNLRQEVTWRVRSERAKLWCGGCDESCKQFKDRWEWNENWHGKITEFCYTMWTSYLWDEFLFLLCTLRRIYQAKHTEKQLSHGQQWAVGHNKIVISRTNTEGHYKIVLSLLLVWILKFVFILIFAHRIKSLHLLKYGTSPNFLPEGYIQSLCPMGL